MSEKRVASQPCTLDVSTMASTVIFRIGPTSVMMIIHHQPALKHVAGLVMHTQDCSSVLSATVATPLVLMELMVQYATVHVLVTLYNTVVEIGLIASFLLQLPRRWRIAAHVSWMFHG